MYTLLHSSPQLDAIRAELELKEEREKRWMSEKSEMEELFLQQRQVLKNNPTQQHGSSTGGHIDNRGATVSGSNNRSSYAREADARASGYRTNRRAHSYSDGHSSQFETGASLPPGHDDRSAFHTGNKEYGFHSSGRQGFGDAGGSTSSGRSREMSDTELIARLRIHDRGIYEQVQRKYFSGEAGARGIAFAANLSRQTQSGTLNSYYWPVGRDRF